MAKNGSSSATKVDTLTLKPSEATIAIKHMIQVNLDNAKLGKKRRGLFIWGPPGIAKSSIVQQIAHEINFKLIDIRLTQMEPTDLRGIPVPTKSDTGEVVVNWAIPEILPRRDKDSRTSTINKPVVERTSETDTTYDGAIILLDELPNAAPSVQAGSYQLVLDAELGEYVVPDNVIVLAAGNRDTDKGSTFKMPTPLMNRFTHIELKSDFKDWQEHALRSGFHADVVGYLSAFKTELFQFDAMSASRGFPTPRSWETVSDILRGDPNLPEIVKTALIGGAVGDGIAVKFLEYQKHTAKLPKPEDILDGRIKQADFKETSLMYALTTSLCYELKERFEISKKDPSTKDSFHKAADAFLGFMMDNFQPEMTIMGARTALAVFRIQFDPSKLTRWDDFSDRYQSLIMNA